MIFMGEPGVSVSTAVVYYCPCFPLAFASWTPLRLIGLQIEPERLSVCVFLSKTMELFGQKRGIHPKELSAANISVDKMMGT